MTCIACAVVVLLVNAAIVGYCLRIIWKKIFSPSREQAASSAPTAADVPEPGIAGGGPGAQDEQRSSHISMTAVIQPNDEVRQSACSDQRSSFFSS